MGRSRQPVSTAIARRFILVTLGVAVVLAPIACSSPQSPSLSAPTTTATGEPPPAADLSGQGTLALPGQISNAFTYDAAVAPIGALLRLTLTASSETTTATFDASGLLPNRGYAVHLHSNSCGLVGEAAGPHFQHRVDPAATPETPSTDPQFANPSNEVWLDVRTDATGAGRSSTVVLFPLTDRVPASVVVHEEMMTATDPGKAGNAGDRVACFTLPSK
ncbi:MAG: superoxide dismutase [Pseudonocardiaceae bacterium]